MRNLRLALNIPTQEWDEVSGESQVSGGIVKIHSGILHHIPDDKMEEHIEVLCPTGITCPDIVSQGENLVLSFDSTAAMNAFVGRCRAIAKDSMEKQSSGGAMYNVTEIEVIARAVAESIPATEEDAEEQELVEEMEESDDEEMDDIEEMVEEETPGVEEEIIVEEPMNTKAVMASLRRIASRIAM